MLTQEGYSNKYAPNECWHKKVIPTNMHQMMNVDTRCYSNKYAPNGCWHKKVIPINMHQMNECWHKMVIPINMHQMNVDTRRLFQ